MKAALILALALLSVTCNPLNKPKEPPKPSAVSGPSEGEMFQRKLRCAELGRAYAKSESQNPERGVVYLESRFSYNPALNTCLVSMGMTSKSFHFFFTVDLATNRALVDYMSEDPRFISSQEYRDYEAKRRELMGESK